jgi:uncharacterized membrane protein YccC
VLKRTLTLDLLGVRVAVNIFVAGTLLWLILREFQQLNPIWAISSMIAASDPVVETARKFFRGRLANALVGCGTGLVILFVGGSSEWKIPIALSMSAFCAAVGLREVERSASGFFFPFRRPAPAWEGRVVATKRARAKPAIDCFPRIMMYGSCGDPRVSLNMD